MPSLRGTTVRWGVVGMRSDVVPDRVLLTGAKPDETAIIHAFTADIGATI